MHRETSRNENMTRLYTNERWGLLLIYIIQNKTTKPEGYDR